jgi:hypothetical protein
MTAPLQSRPGWRIVARPWETGGHDGEQAEPGLVPEHDLGEVGSGCGRCRGPVIARRTESRPRVANECSRIDAYTRSILSRPTPEPIPIFEPSWAFDPE